MKHLAIFFLLLLLTDTGLFAQEQLTFDSIYTVTGGLPGKQRTFDFSIPSCPKQDSFDINFFVVDTCDQVLLQKWNGTTWSQAVTTGCLGARQNNLGGGLNPQGPLVFTGQLQPEGFDPLTMEVTGWWGCHKFTNADGTAYTQTLPGALVNWGSGIIRFPSIPGQYRLTVTNNPVTSTDWILVMPTPTQQVLSITQVTSVTCNPDSMGTYTDTLIATGGCDSIVTMTIVMNDGCNPQDSGCVYVPNAFSPNDDGINDVFMIFAGDECAVKVKSFHVFDRWGEEVFKNFDFPANDQAYGWDGYFKGKPMDTSVFAWFAEVEFGNGSKKILKGAFTLVK